MKKPEQLPEAWRAYAEDNRQILTREAAGAIERCANELERAWAAYWDEPLPLKNAAAESGYDPDSLGRVLRERPELNVGRKHAPRIRRKDLPRHPGTRSASAAGDNLSSLDQFTSRVLASSGRR